MDSPKFVEFETSDGLTLPGLLYEAKGSKKIVIYLHGNGSSSVFYDESGHRDLPDQLIKNGISLLKFNNRGAHIIKKLNIKKDGIEVDRKLYGMAFEKIKDCVPDIDGAITFLHKLGYTDFFLAGASTGANKICVYDHYKPENIFNKYVLICGSDDTGLYYSKLGKTNFLRLLAKAKEKIAKGQGMEIAPESLALDEIFSYQGFYDIANPDGDYNCFPFSEAFMGVNISTKPLFRYFAAINKSTLCIYGENDEFTWGDINRVVKTLKNYQPKFDYHVIKDTDHKFTGKQDELAKIVAGWLK